MSTNVFEKYTDAQSFAKIVDFANLTEMWQHCVNTYSDKSAVVDNGVDYTFASLDAEIAQFRTVLKNNGVNTGDIIGILAPNSVGFIKAYMAANTYGVATVLLPPHLDAIQHPLQLSHNLDEEMPNFHIHQNES